MDIVDINCKGSETLSITVFIYSYVILSKHGADANPKLSQFVMVVFQLSFSNGFLFGSKIAANQYAGRSRVHVALLRWIS